MYIVDNKSRIPNKLVVTTFLPSGEEATISTRGFPFVATDMSGLVNVMSLFGGVSATEIFFFIGVFGGGVSFEDFGVRDRVFVAFFLGVACRA